MSTTWKMPPAPPPLPSPIPSRRREHTASAQGTDQRSQLRQWQSSGVSLMVHCCLLLSLALLSTTGGGSGRNQSTPVVIMQAEAGAETTQGVFVEDVGASMLGSDDSVGGESTLGGEVGNGASGLPGADQPPIDVQSSFAAGAGGGDGGLKDVGEAAGGLGLGSGGSKLGGSGTLPQVKTSVFGIEGSGTRFVYVFDRSSSMNGYTGLPMANAKSELIKSLQSIGRVHQFQLIFYNETPMAFGQLAGSTAMMSGTDENKQSAVRYVRNMVPDGGTEHLSALRMALGMNPDVIFFLTDAEEPGMSGRDLTDLIDRAERIGAVIHTIQFGTGGNQSSDSWIVELARATRGKYRYIDVTTFKPSS